MQQAPALEVPATTSSKQSPRLCEHGPCLFVERLANFPEPLNLFKAMSLGVLAAVKLTMGIDCPGCVCRSPGGPSAHLGCSSLSIFEPGACH